MNIEKLLNENLESFYPWSDNDTPPLDTNKKTFIEKEKETLENHINISELLNKIKNTFIDSSLRKFVR